MADTFSIKEYSGNKHQDKQSRREERKTNNNKSVENMLVYADINGNFTSVPTHLQSREEDLPAENKLVSKESENQESVFIGIVTFYSEKGYGFITEDKTGNNIFFHHEQLTQPVIKHDKVSYGKESSLKGDKAVNITK